MSKLGIVLTTKVPVRISKYSIAFPRKNGLKIWATHTACHIWKECPPLAVVSTYYLTGKFQMHKLFPTNLISHFMCLQIPLLAKGVEYTMMKSQFTYEI